MLSEMTDGADENTDQNAVAVQSERAKSARVPRATYQRAGFDAARSTGETERVSASAL